MDDVAFVWWWWAAVLAGSFWNGRSAFRPFPWCDGGAHSNGCTLSSSTAATMASPSFRMAVEGKKGVVVVVGRCHEREGGGVTTSHVESDDERVEATPNDDDRLSRPFRPSLLTLVEGPWKERWKGCGVVFFLCWCCCCCSFFFFFLWWWAFLCLSRDVSLRGRSK